MPNLWQAPRTGALILLEYLGSEVAIVSEADSYGIVATREP